MRGRRLGGVHGDLVAVVMLLLFLIQSATGCSLAFVKGPPEGPPPDERRLAFPFVESRTRDGGRQRRAVRPARAATRTAVAAAAPRAAQPTTAGQRHDQRRRCTIAIRIRATLPATVRPWRAAAVPRARGASTAAPGARSRPRRRDAPASSPAGSRRCPSPPART